MAGSFLVSRALLSVFMALTGIVGLWGVPPRQWVRNRWWQVGAAWVAMYALSYFWSEHKDVWYEQFQVKYPFLLLPMALPFLPRFSRRQLTILTVTFGIMLALSTFYSLSFLLRDPAHFIYGYKQSHLIPTLPKRDHIRASLTYALYIVWSVYVWPWLDGRRARWITGICIGVLVVFLHILAAKSGLVSLYLFLSAWGIYLAVGRRKVMGLVLVVAIPLAVMAAIRFVPTFRERANYIGYSLYMLRNGDRSAMYGDIARLQSYKIAFQVISDHPLLGVGAGDMLPEMNKYYDQWYPTAPPEGRLVPHNQFLCVGLACGIPTMVVFIIWAFMPLGLMRRNRGSFFLAITWLVLLVQLLIEPVLEVQFGVFVYIFFLLLLMHEVKNEPVPAN